MKLHFVQHEFFEAPGAFLLWAKRHNHILNFSRVYEQDALPKTVTDIDCLVVLGGPQSPDTTLEECPYFDANAEMELIRQCIQAGKMVIGVCLGAQLIGEALGAKTEHSPEMEIGVFPIRLTEEGFADKNIRHFGSVLQVGHWHGDMPGLTSEARVLATSLGCPRQIVAYSDRVYGFQCHLEFTSEVVELLIAENRTFLENTTTHRYVQKPDEIRQYDYTEMNTQLYGFLDRLEQFFIQK